MKKQPDESNSSAKPKRRGLSMGIIVAFIAIAIAVWSGRSHKPIESASAGSPAATIAAEPTPAQRYRRSSSGGDARIRQYDYFPVHDSGLRANGCQHRKSSHARARWNGLDSWRRVLHGRQ